jgi:hypothetical protein
MNATKVASGREEHGGHGALVAEFARFFTGLAASWAIPN